MLMLFLQPTNPRTQTLRIINFVSAFLLLLGAVWIFIWPQGTGGSPASREDRVRAIFTQQSRPVWNLVTAELEKARLEAKAAADWATHIFSNPESYRLAPQPSEYDFDESTGLFGSVRNDGSSVALLSASSPMSPGILREIRLSEYVNPILKTAVSLNPNYRQITLYTTDSLVRSYPWFDFRSLVASGSLKRQFSVTDLPFFAMAMPSKNPRREAVCEVVTADIPGKGTQLVCAAPFFSGETFRGVVAVGVDGQKLATHVFEKAGIQQSLALLFGSGNWVLGSTRGLEQRFSRSIEQSVQTLQDLKVKNNSGLGPIFRQLSGSPSSGRQGDFSWSVVSDGAVPVRLLTVLSEDEISALDPGVAKPFPRLLLMVGSLLCGLLLAVNARWMLGAEHSLRDSQNQATESFAALSELNLNSVSVEDSQVLLSEMGPELDDTFAPAQELLDDRDAAQPEDVPLLPAQGFTEDIERIEEELSVVSQQVRIYSSLDAGESLEANLSRLAAVLSGIFSAGSASFFSYSPSESAFRPSFVEATETASCESQPVPELKEGRLFESLAQLRSVTCGSATELSSEELAPLASLFHQNYLAAPLLEEGKLLGAILLGDKSDGFSVRDQEMMGALQNALSKTLKNLYQCEGLSKLDLLRREYCSELAKAVEVPLNKIREEVQSIFARLGKLTPYYKQHCETILFEVGKLYEIVREAREVEPVAEAPLPAAHVQSEG